MKDNQPKAAMETPVLRRCEYSEDWYYLKIEYTPPAVREIEMAKTLRFRDNQKVSRNGERYFEYYNI